MSRTLCGPFYREIVSRHTWHGNCSWDRGEGLGEKWRPITCSHRWSKIWGCLTSFSEVSLCQYNGRRLWETKDEQFDYLFLFTPGNMLPYKMVIVIGAVDRCYLRERTSGSGQQWIQGIDQWRQWGSISPISLETIERMNTSGLEIKCDLRKGEFSTDIAYGTHNRHCSPFVHQTINGPMCFKGWRQDFLPRNDERKRKTTFLDFTRSMFSGKLWNALNMWSARRLDSRSDNRILIRSVFCTVSRFTWIVGKRCKRGQERSTF